MSKVQLIFAIHNHQPVGNFESVAQEAYQKAYLPFIEVLKRHPGVRVVLHYTGILYQFFEKHHPEFLETLRERHPGCYRFYFDFGLGGAFIGASPERLVRLRGVRVASDAIAGTAVRPASPDEEIDAIAALRGSAKESERARDRGPPHI